MTDGEKQVETGRRLEEVNGLGQLALDIVLERALTSRCVRCRADSRPPSVRPHWRLEPAFTSDQARSMLVRSTMSSEAAPSHLPFFKTLDQFDLLFSRLSMNVNCGSGEPGFVANARTCSFSAHPGCKTIWLSVWHASPPEAFGLFLDRRGPPGQGRATLVPPSPSADEALCRPSSSFSMRCAISL